MSGRSAPGAADPAPFGALSPDAILEAVDSVLDAHGSGADRRSSGQILPLNSYENRVFQLGMEGSAGGAPAAPLVAKFYRPDRWTDAQILEEHGFLAELVEAEVPAVAPLRLGGQTLHRACGYRFALFERRGGRAPELGDAAVRERLGRFLGRLHAVGARSGFSARQKLDIDTFGHVPSQWLLAHDWLPPELAPAYRSVLAQALEGVERAWQAAAPLRILRAHGDCHPGNLLWSDEGAQPGPYFLDFDDSAMAPAVQDLWMLLSGERAEMALQLRDVLRGYELFTGFERRELLLVEALRTLRLIHYAAWIARRWSDPAFPAAFPWFREPRYWEARILELREQVGAMQEPPLES